MCNEAARRTALGLMREDFSQQKIPLRFPEGLPNLGESLSIRITDSTVIVRAAAQAAGEAEMVQRRWSWVGPTKKPVYNYRSEGRTFRNSESQGRCLIPLDGFYEFTDAPPLSAPPVPPRGKVKKDKWLFTLAEVAGEGRVAEHDDRPAPGMFCVAGLWKGGADLGKPKVGGSAAGGVTGEAFTMLTCEPGPDIAPYHSRQIVLMPRDRWADWLAGEVPAADLIAPTPAGTLKVERVG